MQRTVTEIKAQAVKFVNGVIERIEILSREKDEEKLINKLAKKGVSVDKFSIVRSNALYILDDEIFFKYAKRYELDENGKPIGLDETELENEEE